MDMRENYLSYGETVRKHWGYREQSRRRFDCGKSTPEDGDRILKKLDALNEFP